MVLFRKIKDHRYDMDTLDGINSIPVPAKNYNTGDWTKDCIYYVLQRKATEHKKNGNIELAIACLRKSNELSDYESRPPLLHKDYIRLVKYLEAAGRFYEASLEKDNIYKKHPEFLDKRVSNLKQVKNALLKCKEYQNDFVFIATNRNCPVCSKFNRKIYSISGESEKYPKLPDEFISYGGFCKDCSLSIVLYFEGYSTFNDDC